MWTFLGAVLVAVSYIAAIYSWPGIMIRINGASIEAANLRQKAAQLEARLGRL